MLDLERSLIFANIWTWRTTWKIVSNDPTDLLNPRAYTDYRLSFLHRSKSSYQNFFFQKDTFHTYLRLSVNRAEWPSEGLWCTIWTSPNLHKKVNHSHVKQYLITENIVDSLAFEYMKMKKNSNRFIIDILLNTSYRWTSPWNYTRTCDRFPSQSRGIWANRKLDSHISDNHKRFAIWKSCWWLIIMINFKW